MSDNNSKFRQVSAYMKPEGVRGGATLTVDRPSFVIGKASGKADGLIEENSAVSRIHCTVSCGAGEYSISDAGSTNGTFVNGKRLRRDEQRLLHDGDHIKIADFEYVFSLKEPRMVLFCSATGGSGKTTLALGVAACLAASGRKVLYIDAEMTHTFQMYLSDKCYLPNSAYALLAADGGVVFDDISRYLRAEGFDYLPPFRASLPSAGLSYGFYVDFILAATASGRYDYLLVDTDAAMHGFVDLLTDMADKVCITFTPDDHSLFKTDILTNSLDVGDTDKYMFLCNKYDALSDGAIVPDDTTDMNAGIRYIGRIGDLAAKTAHDLSESDEIQRFAEILSG
jgi:MinD-like ATPase involved in chromosome partitioning or flagellar assembly